MSHTDLKVERYNANNIILYYFDIISGRTVLCSADDMVAMVAAGCYGNHCIGCRGSNS